MAVQAKMELVEPPHEAEGTTCLRDLHEGQEFVDDVSGLPLDKGLATQARRVDIGFFRKIRIYTKFPQEPWMQVITTKWLDVNKGDVETPNYRATLVGREVACEKRDDLYAATLPLESLRALLSLCASRQKGRNPWRIMAIDVKRACVYAGDALTLRAHPKRRHVRRRLKKGGQAELKLVRHESCSHEFDKSLHRLRTGVRLWEGRQLPLQFPSSKGPGHDSSRR